MRLHNDIEFSLLRLQIYEDISSTGQVSEASVIAFKDFILSSSEYNGKLSMIVKNILNISTWNILNHSDDREAVCANYMDLLHKIDANITSINIEFFYNLFRATCGKFNNKFTGEIYTEEGIALLEAITDITVPNDYHKEKLEVFSTLLRLYLNNYEKYKDRIYPVKVKLQKLVEEEKQSQHEDDLFN